MADIIDFDEAKQAKEIEKTIEEFGMEMDSMTTIEQVEDVEICIGTNGMWLMDDEMMHCITWTDLVDIFDKTKADLLEEFQDDGTTEDC